MKRIVSFSVLVGVLLLTAILFYRVMAGFFLPLFMALLLIVIFRPMHVWIVKKCRGHDRVAAGLTTVAIMAIVLAPLALVMVQATVEGVAIAKQLESAKLGQGQLEVVAVDTIESIGIQLSEEERTALVEQIRTGTKNLLAEFLQPALVGGVQLAGGILIGLGIMIVAIYYFLVDGPAMIDAVMRLSPLDDKHETKLFEQFDGLSRAVVVAMLLSAVTQAVLGGAAYWVLGFDALFLLTALTGLLAMVPFVGAASVWVPCALYLHFHDARTAAAIGLAVYGTVAISMADNLIKPLVLHGQANLHPLLALLSILGGVQALGPIGIVVGPMIVAFLQTLLNMLHNEIQSMDGLGVPSLSEAKPSAKSK
jgi:predicted PurR-regulated permease PerM